MSSILVRLFITLSIGVLAACGKSEVSRSDAQTAIESRLRETIKSEVMTLILGEDAFSSRFSIDVVENGLLKRYRESGLVNVEVTGTKNTSGIDWTLYRTSPTDLLRPLILKSEPFSYAFNSKLRLQVKVGGELGKVTVTGLVKSSPTQTEAKFDFETTYNEAGQKLFATGAMKKWFGRAVFTLNDDGWRISDFGTSQQGF